MRIKHLLLIVCILLSAASAALGQDNIITIPDVSVANGKTISLPVNMDNSADVVAVQFTLTVPDGLSINASSAALSDRSDNHSVTFRSIGGNNLCIEICARLILLYSYRLWQNNTFIGIARERENLFIGSTAASAQLESYFSRI